MNKNKIRAIVFIILCVIVLWGVNEVVSFDGYYRSVDTVIAHEKNTLKGEEEIALIPNGLGFVEIMSVDDTVLFYDFKSKNTITGKKYAVRSCLTQTINYDKIAESYPPKEEWEVFSIVNIKKQAGEKNLYWWIVKKSDDLQVEEDIKCYEYNYNGLVYCLLCTFI